MSIAVEDETLGQMAIVIANLPSTQLVTLLTYVLTETKVEISNIKPRDADLRALVDFLGAASLAQKRARDMVPLIQETGP